MNVKQEENKRRKKKREDLYLIGEYYHKYQLTKDSPIKCICKFCNRVYMCHIKRLLGHLARLCKKCPLRIKSYMQTLEKKVLAKKEDDAKSKNDSQMEENGEKYTALDDELSKTSRYTKCFVYGCNRTRAEFGFFSAPKESREREVWNSIIAHPFQQRNLKQTDFICERHFAPSDIVRYLVVNGVRIPNKTPVLRRGCLPIKFFDDYVLKSYNRHITKLITKSDITEKRKKTDSEEQNDQESRYFSTEVPCDLGVIEELSVNPEFEIVIENETSHVDFETRSNVPYIQDEKVDIKTEPIEEISWENSLGIEVPNVAEYSIDTLIKSEPCHMNLHHIKDEINYDSDSSEDEDIENIFFERIFETKSFPGLNDYWAICPCKNYVKPILQNLVSENKSVVFTQMKVRNGIPITDKQIILGEDLKVTYFVGQNQITERDLLSTVSNITELAAAINHYSTLNSCEGGPDINEYEFIIIGSQNTYIKDYSNQTWRHTRCTFLLESGTVCMYCKYVKKYFKQRQKVKKSLANQIKPVVWTSTDINSEVKQISGYEDCDENYLEGASEQLFCEI